MITRITTRVGYTEKGRRQLDVFHSSGLQILRHFFWLPKTKVDFYIASKYSYWKIVKKDKYER